jgi:hypothetical protein
MKLERSNVEFPLWCKKVDKSLFEHSGTTIPVWACNMWGLPELFHDVSSKLDERSKVKVRYLNKIYDGWVTTARHGRNSPALRLWYEEELSLKLKYSFLMSYMRSLEQRLRIEKKTDIEKDIPFWEFLDIEFDKQDRLFRFVAYYKQEPSFPNLFERLIESPGLKKVADEIEGKKEKRIYKQDWKHRNQLAFEIGATNVLYTLIDSNRRLIYIGEAKDLISRLNGNHPSIPHWDYFRYDVLPDALAPFRIALERMLIRAMAALVVNNKKIDSMNVSDYILTNEKIDR